MNSSIDYLSHHYGIADKEALERELTAHGLERTEECLLCGRYLLSVSERAVKPMGEAGQPVITVPERVHIIAQNAFRDCGRAAGIVLPPELEMTRTDRTFLPCGLDWVVVPRLAEQKAINWLYAGIDSSMLEVTEEQQYMAPRLRPTIWYMGNTEETAALSRHFGIKELHTKGAQVCAYPFSSTHKGARGCWHFADGLPRLYTLDETTDSVIFLLDDNSTTHSLSCRLRCLNPGMQLREDVEVTINGTTRTGVQAFVDRPLDKFYKLMRRFDEIFELGSYLYLEISDQPNCVYVCELTAAGNAVRLGQVDYEGGGAVEISYDRSHMVGHVLLMYLSHIMQVYPQLETLTSIRPFFWVK